MANFYIDGTTLSNSTAVYTDDTFTTCAPAAFYSDGIISREQVVTGSNCQLLPQQACPSCATACGTLISVTGQKNKIFRIITDLGSTVTDIGAVILRFNPNSIPNGIKVVYNNITYNKLSSPTFGYLQANSGGVPTTEATFVGDTGSQAGCGTGTIEGSYINQNVLKYLTNAFVDTGTVEDTTVVASQNQLTAGAPLECVMVIPKLLQSPSFMDVEILSTCTSSVWSFDSVCPVVIPQLLSGYNINVADVCSELFEEHSYHVPVNALSTQNDVNLHDYIFSDENGALAAIDGWYLHPTGYKYEVTLGIVTDKIDTCPTITISDCTDAQVWTMNDRFGAWSVGDVLQYQRIDAVTQTVNPLVYCGTITSLGVGVDTNAQSVSALLVNNCNDIIECPNN